MVHAMAQDQRAGPTVVVRRARPGDVPTVLAMVKELAEYEDATSEVSATESMLSLALFGERPAAYCHVVECDGQVGGFALWFVNFSTWLGVHGIYLEDLYVRPAVRGLGLGEALLRALAELCLERGYGRLEWSVLDRNAPALGFYRALGAEAMQDWTVHRLAGDTLRALARGAE